MSKHTPGPWTCHLGQPDDMPEMTCRCASILGGEYAGAIGEVFEDNGKKVSEGGNDCPPQSEARANARLIAGAPDLLEALNALEAECGVANSSRSSVEWEHPTRAAARAAILKAGGSL